MAKASVFAYVVDDVTSVSWIKFLSANFPSELKENASLVKKQKQKNPVGQILYTFYSDVVTNSQTLRQSVLLNVSCRVKSIQGMIETLFLILFCLLFFSLLYTIQILIAVLPVSPKGITSVF